MQPLSWRFASVLSPRAGRELKRGALQNRLQSFFNCSSRYLVLALILGLLFPLCAQDQHPSPSKDAEVLPIDKLVNVKQGEKFAHSVCAACHMFPEPEMLDKKTWEHGAFMRMAPLLGVGHLNLDKRPDGAILTST